jgi:light-regulated signal transduction histidine kinase (bacteriophytochrome)
MSIVAKGKPQRYILASSCPFFDAQHNLLGAVAVMHDITERRRAEEKLAETVDSLNASNRDLEQFAYIASHDLQEPLRMVANYVQLLERRYKDKLDQDAKDFIYYASDGAVRMQQLIDSLLEYARLHSRQKQFKTVNLDRVLQRVLRDLEKSILESGARITAGPLPDVFGDDVQLGQVFQNLISNALKFKGEDSPKIQIDAEEFYDHWKITVRDNGIGIEPEYQERIFKIFQRLHSRADYSGTGIGLAVFKRIIERHNGTSGVESAAGKGSSFWFTLPKKEEI